MCYDVCILSGEADYAAMLALELEDRGMCVTICQTAEEAAKAEAACFLVDADAFSFVPHRGRLVCYGRHLDDAADRLHRPFLLTALCSAMQGGGVMRGLSLPEGEQFALLDGERILLTAREYACLACLMQAKGKPVSRAQLLAAVWGAGETDEGAVTVYLHYLRKKLERHGKKIIYAVRGCGYALREEEEA